MILHFSFIECVDAELISIMVWSLTNALRESPNFELKGGIEILQFEEKMRTFTFFNFNVLRCPMKNKVKMTMLTFFRLLAIFYHFCALYNVHFMKSK